MSRIKPNTEAFSMPKKRPEKKKDYLRFLHELPCCVSGTTGVQAAHVSFPNPWYGAYGRGKGSKVSDRLALPLCAELHTLQHSGRLGSEQAFWGHYGIDPHSLANTLFCIYQDYEEAEAIQFCAARIMQGMPK